MNLFFATLALVIAGAVSLPADEKSPPAKDPFQSLSFLEGTWSAKAKGAHGVTAIGTYTFRMELGDHILARHSTSDSTAKKSATFDYQHGDLLYVFPEMPGPTLKAIYFDSEGHVLHYAVTTPTPTSVLFLSDSPPGAPQFRLMYERKGDAMSGKFQILPPGQKDWLSYLEWSGKKL